jgi:hypothetical protein
MTFTHALSTNNYGPCKLIVATSAANGTHTTLASAMAAASVGDTIFLRDSVTENVTITPGVNIACWDANGINVPSITGKLTMTGAGTSTISGIRLVTNSDFCLSITGSAASILYLVNCYLDATNNTAIQYSSSSASSLLYLKNVDGNLGTTGIAFFSMSSAGTVRYQNGLILNSGGSTTSDTFSAGSFFPIEVSYQNPVTISGTAILSCGRCTFNCGGLNVSSLTINTSGSCNATYCNFTGGTASAITITSGTLLINEAQVNSSNTNAITGAGTIQYGLIVYSGSSSTNNVSTQTKLPTQPSIPTGSGAWTLLQTQTASNSANITFTSTYITSTYNKYALVMNNVVPATNGVSMSMTVSVDNGSNYLATGYKAVINVFSEAATANAVSSTTLIPLTIITGNTLANTAGIGLMGTLYMLNWTSGSSFPEIHGNCSYLESSAANTLTGLWGGRAPTTNVINNIKIVMSSGNISTGTFSLYGISS